MKNILLTILSVLFGLMMLNSGLNKFFHYMPMPPSEIMDTMVSLKWLFPLVAINEILAGVLLLFPKTRLFGAIVIVPTLLGIIAHHSVWDKAGILVGLILFVINLFILFNYRNKIKNLFL